MEQTPDKLFQFIRTIFPMPLSQAGEIVSLFKPKSFEKNEWLLKQGRPCNEYYFLEEGYMRAYTFDLDGNDVTTAFYSGNQIVCELFSFFKRIPSKENIQALSECHTRYITFEELNGIFHAMPEFREFGRTILINAYSGLKQRMLSMLHETAEERYGNLLRNNPDIFNHAALKNIATYLGITDTSLSRIRKEFSKKN
ncbi:MAG TPA: Crp/Fnr family transcriptional regulator [Chitinophagaceae bacterium]|jgi:CRP-like cAMP-binding protein|nr:Crp/Fnr family transcriptional regulator [Chitinophagaceae bacterium]